MHCAISGIYTLQNTLYIKFFQPYKCMLAVKSTTDNVFLSHAFQGKSHLKLSLPESIVLSMNGPIYTLQQIQVNFSTTKSSGFISITYSDFVTKCNFYLFMQVSNSVTGNVSPKMRLLENQKYFKQIYF